MLKKKVNPYEHCPVYQTGQFVIRLVRAEDAGDLLACYSDPRSAKLFNSDNCTSNFIYHSLAEMQNCIEFWLDDYRRHGYVRYSILDQKTGKAIGTIEFFAREGTSKVYGKVGLLRIDLASSYEKENLIAEILNLVESHFYDDFEVDSVITKAVPEAEQRISALKAAGYQALPGHTILPYDAYYLQGKKAES